MTFLYEKLLKPILFSQDPEKVHDAFTFWGHLFGTIPPARWKLALFYRYRHPALRQTVAGIRFENPVGLAAGFDKDCRLMDVLPSVGFGYEEVGSITAEPYAGNPKPRLVRLPADKSIIVYYGLKNKGAKAVRPLLLNKRFRFPVGVSVAKTNREFTGDKEKLDDWIKGISLMKDAGDYLTINVSCPNTYDPNNYCDPKLLEKLLFRIDNEKLAFGKPIFLKITADLSENQADEIIRIAAPRKWITGFVVSNLVKDRATVKLKSPRELHEHHKGGLSGKVQQPKALALVRHFRKRAGDRFVLIGCGGIFTAEDAYAYIKAGANLVQLITGMIYKGPGVIKEINKGLVRLLEKDGYTNISQAVGNENKR
jgi:dihydroorotate dehydrogenase